MENTKRTTWVAGTVLLAVTILALAWFVFIAPVVSETSTVADDTQVAEDRNTALTNQLATLQAQFAELETYERERDLLAKQIPATASTSEFLRTVEGLKVAAGTNVVDVQFGLPEEVLPAAAVVTDTTVTETDTAAGAAAEGEATEAEAPASAGTAAPVIPGFIAVPVSVTALGNPVGVLAFMNGLQQTSDRLMLVTGLQGSGQDQEDASGGRPATADGDLELIITGYIYVLEDGTTTVAPEGDATEPDAALPQGAPSLSGA
jgi:hypothetical protein